MHRHHDIFVRAIKEKKKIRLFYATNDSSFPVKICIPIDYNPGERTDDKSDYYHFWDFDTGANKDPLALNSKQIEGMYLDKESFDPMEFITWKRNKYRQWFVTRNWGQFS
ncbi:MAG: hypothetical protein KAS75_00225 [Planctomycetes bacterium]|nr:hypothetical protein [Planctomycetota bacterium]